MSWSNNENYIISTKNTIAVVSMCWTQAEKCLLEWVNNYHKNPPEEFITELFSRNMKPHISILVAYFKKELPNLKNNYSWKIPQIEGFDENGERSYSANVKLKKFFNEKWKNANRNARINLAKTVVSDWGGVRNNKLDTLKAYIDELEKDLPSTPIKGVASYSKIFSIAALDSYAIYDARVAVSLNAIQWNSNINRGIAFNYIPGRNKTTGDATKRKGFAYDKHFKVTALVKTGWKRVKRNETYQYYMNTLKECLKHLPDYKIHDLEMALFANAEKECAKALQKLSVANKKYG